jgi:hypothetical protein
MGNRRVLYTYEHNTYPAHTRERRYIMRITNEQFNYRVKMIEEMMKEQGLLEGDTLEDSSYESMREPHLILQVGSPTYGNAWRLFATGGTKYRSAHYDPMHLTLGYLGFTRSEAWQTLTGIYVALSAISWKAQQKAYALKEAN